MFKRFIEGLVFGAGFAIAFVAIWFITSLFVWPTVYDMASGEPGFEDPKPADQVEEPREPTEKDFSSFKSP